MRPDYNIYILTWVMNISEKNIDSIKMGPDHIQILTWVMNISK
jgi:hypothetical protein